MRALLIDAICGIGFYSEESVADLERRGLVTYTGRMGCPWIWRHSRMETHTETGLIAIYLELCAARKEAEFPCP